MAAPHVVNIEAEIIQKLVINPPAQPPVIPEPSRNEPKLITDDVPQPIVIARMRDQELIVDNDALFQFLDRDDLTDQPLVIVSIAGAYRTGKSFLLNFFLRYLRNKGWKNENWFGDDDTMIIPHGPGFSFSFERGDEGVTKDILVCPQVFQIPLKDKRMARAILVDTQGLFDEGLTADSNARIMSISMLFSSLQLLNIMRQIDSTHLQSLQLWTTISAATASISPDEDSQAFQDLAIVVRDYEHGKYAFGKSNNYMQDVLRRFSRIGQMDQANTAVRRVFSDMRCFVLPRPGDIVAEGSEEMTNGDMKENFKKAVKILVEDVLNPENLSVKKTNGKEADSTDLLNLLGRVGKAYERGEAPEAQTALQASILANNTKALNEAVLEYRNHMSKKCGGIKTAEKMRVADEKAKQLAEKRFHAIATLGNEGDKNEYFSRLKTEYGDEFKSFIQRNEEEKKRILTKFEIKVMRYEDRYRQAIQQKVENVTLQSLQKLHTKLEKENMTKFAAKMKKYQEKVPDILELKGKLECRISLIYTVFKSQHKSQCSNLVERSRACMIAKFTKETDERTRQCVEEIENDLSSLLSAYIEEYRTEILGKVDENDLMAQVEQLERELEEKKSCAISLNTERKNLVKKACETAGISLGNCFEDSLKMATIKGFISPECFERYVDGFLSKNLLPVLKESAGEKNIPEWGKQIVRQKFDEKIAVIRERNHGNKIFRSIRFELLNLSDKMTSAIRDIIKSLFRGMGKEPSTSEIVNEASDCAKIATDPDVIEEYASRLAALIIADFIKGLLNVNEYVAHPEDGELNPCVARNTTILLESCECVCVNMLPYASSYCLQKRRLLAMPQLVPKLSLSYLKS